MPSYNEEKTLPEIIKKILEIKWPVEVELVIVNDGSKDNSWELLQKYSSDSRIKLINNEKNLGKSRTVKRGILASTGDLVVIQDADLEYNPENLLMFLDAFEKTNVDIVYGNRFDKKNKVIYISNWIGNQLLSALSSMFTGPRNGMWTKDMEVCYKMVRGDIFREISRDLTATTSFGIEPEITAKLSKYKKEGNVHLKFKQIPIDYYPRTIEEGKKMRGLSDGYKAFLEILKYNI
ncbi:MAG: glycosyltransferase family 2 protein [bacterium]